MAPRRSWSAFDAELALAVIEQHRRRTVSGCRRCSRVYSSCRPSWRDRYDRSSMRYAIHSGGACPGGGEAGDDRAVGPVLFSSSTQAPRGPGPRRSCRRNGFANRGSVGKPLMGRPYILDDDGTGAPGGRSRHDLVRGRRRLLLPRRPGQDRRRTTPGAGHQSATSATWTRTGTCSSATAAPT